MSPEIVVKSDRDWFGDQRSGSYVVYLDGRRVAVLRPRDSVAIRCDAGSHRVRVRQWHYLSPSVSVQVGESDPVTLQADVRHRERAIVRRMATLMFRPWQGLSLRVVPSGEGAPAAEV